MGILGGFVPLLMNLVQMTERLREILSSETLNSSAVKLLFYCFKYIQTWNCLNTPKKLLPMTALVMQYCSSSLECGFIYFVGSLFFKNDCQTGVTFHQLQKCHKNHHLMELLCKQQNYVIQKEDFVNIVIFQAAHLNS